MNTYRISRPFQIGLHEFKEGEIITPLDFFGKLHGIDLAPVADYFEPLEIYFMRRCLPVFTKVDGLREDDFSHTGPVRGLSAAMLDLLTANKLNDVSGFDAALERVETILAEVDQARAKTGKDKKAAARAKKIKKAVADETTKENLKKGMGGKLKR